MIPLPNFLQNRVDSSCITSYVITTKKSILTIKRFWEEYQEKWDTKDLISWKWKPEYLKEWDFKIPPSLRDNA